MITSLVIVGLGYVGLPLTYEAVRAGLSVKGLDTSETIVASLNAGQSHIDDLDDQQIAAMVESGFIASADPSIVAEADVVVICVPTPLKEGTTPDLSAVEGAARAVGTHLQPGSLVVLESTTYPGTTDDVVAPILQQASQLEPGVDFHLAFSPERIDPGNQNFGLRNTPKVVGGYTPGCTERAVEFYSSIVDTIVPTVGTREAELAKLLENTYRHVNIALVNEMAIFCREMGIDLWAAIDAAATKPFGFQAFYPGPGVGGHCIPIDPNYLSFSVESLGYKFRFVELAQEISGRMPTYVARRAQDLLNDHGKAINGSRVVLLGVAYKADVSDQRETPARPLARRLMEMGAEVSYFDSYVDRFDVDEHTLPRHDQLSDACASSDLAIVVQSHSDIAGQTCLDTAKLILDTRGVLTGSNVEKL